MNTQHWIADRATRIEVSGIRKVFELGRSLKDPINLFPAQWDPKLGIHVT